jgi:hypothetical protein
MPTGAVAPLFEGIETGGHCSEGVLLRRNYNREVIDSSGT